MARSREDRILSNGVSETSFSIVCIRERAEPLTQGAFNPSDLEALKYREQLTVTVSARSDSDPTVTVEQPEQSGEWDQDFRLSLKGIPVECLYAETLEQLQAQGWVGL